MSGNPDRRSWKLKIESRGIEIPEEHFSLFAGKKVQVSITPILTDPEPRKVTIASKGTRLYFPLTQVAEDEELRNLPLHKYQLIEAAKIDIQKSPEIRNAYYVPIDLLVDLEFSWMEGNRGKCEECECRVEALDQTFKSVNRAYTAASQFFEPDRASHTTNIFNTGYVVIQNKPVTLGQLRTEALANYRHNTGS